MNVLHAFIIVVFSLICCSGSAQSNNNDTHKKIITLMVSSHPITVHGKKTIRYRAIQPDGTVGIVANKGDLLTIIEKNMIKQPTSIHWHGLILPNNQDGVPYLTQYPIKPGQTFPYRYPLIQSGTFWLHSHFGLQEQDLLAAPYIIKDSTESKTDQEVVIMLEDFSFESPLSIYKKLRCQHASMPINHDMMHMENMSMDINDVTYDAFLANETTLENPQIIAVKPNSSIRLRIINASASTNFYINLGELIGTVVAVDGNNIHAIRTKSFMLAMAQRVDIIINIPNENKSFPIISQVEGGQGLTGIILATPNAPIPSLKETAAQASKPFTYSQELALAAKNPLYEKKIDRSVVVNLEGNMEKYIWKINNQIWPDVKPLMVKKGERVELVFNNCTSMSHPMHLHGHVFQVTEINGQKFRGANRDTILVLPNSTVKVQFDANNSGIWMLHCHNLYHAAAGMMTVLLYQDFTPMHFTKHEQAMMSGAHLYTNAEECGK